MIRNDLIAKEPDCFFVFDNLMGDSDWARRIRRRVIQTSSHRINAFVTGPAGTGKRLLARALHEHGTRRGHPFIPVDCSRLQGNLFRSQLFGQVYRETTTLGCFRAADRGTIYIANVDRLNQDSQVELLEVIESKRVTAVGGVDEYPFDARVIIGSKRDLEAEVRQGDFRSDLYRRLCVLPFETTALCTRVADIEPIANHLLAKLTFDRGMKIRRLTPSAVDLLRAYSWPKNVHELHEVLDGALARSKREFIDANDLAIDLNETKTSWLTLADIEANHIHQTIAMTGGDLARAALVLGIGLQELQAKLAQIDAT